ncbi:Fic family protein [Candidatus Berkiella cookevillensis]|uniref:Adenosine monophosphate-protein transferase SoFic n=1 Tax=Candidatus Berkiella cookevillensis TaxID=437022 RepID=A0A0Q9YR87_9GAMM|nr:Fic family protein [Candidatus Berkiella cookevillensis]MCS5707933.1 Fic family protein [Candidatus Berkiella cookevillensis]
MRIPAFPPQTDLDTKVLTSSSALKCNITDSKGRYLHWDKLRFLSPPEGSSSEQWWASIKHARRQMYKHININDPNGKSFVFLYSDEIMSSLHWLDQNASGMIGSSQPIVSSQMKNTYLIRSLIEEAITSSQLEGASTTWRVAKEMLRQGRKPSDKNEQMIYNNYIAMQFIREYKQEKLTPQILLELQKILTENTLEDESHSGYFRGVEDDVKVVSYRGDILHVPPAAELLTQRVKNLCDFSNQATSDIFLHPIIKSIILHFLIGYEHPFVDGNGRTARALFYWSMAQQNYWLIEFISISKIIKKAPVKYGKAYLHTETDENDLTYFIIHQLEIIKEAINDLYLYIDKKTKEIVSAEELFSTSKKLKDKLNYRQLALIKHALKHPGFIYKITEHQNSHGIVYQTARTDLLQLSDKFNFLMKEKKGKSFVFRSPRDLTDRIQGQ